MRKSSLLSLLLVAFASPAAAQVWDAPTFFSPRPMDDIGVYVFQSNAPRGFDDPLGVVGMWRQSGNINLGVKAGVGDTDNAGETILVGAELYGPLGSLLPNTGLELAWNVGAGAVFGDNYAVFSVPVGVSVGVRLGSGNVSILPYVHPRVALDIVSVEFAGDEETDTDGSFAIDLGADVNLGSSLILRLGKSFGDRDAFGAGLAIRWPRGISVGSGR